MSKVYLVGAGPGDPELITMKGRRVLAKADLVLYDHLANDLLLNHAPAAAQRTYVGKKRSEHSHSQEQIIEMMVEHARSGKTVVRLKGGDPFIFGRGGEEVEGLAAAGIAYEVVPGVTAPLGIAAYTGVPLTHREHTSVVTFVTGHAIDAVDWARVGLSETLVIFMGLHHAADILAALLKAGRSPDTPAMVVQWGTRPDQHTITGRLEELPSLIAEHSLHPPATIIIGDVVSLREKLTWYEKLPLFGQEIVVTRARAQSAELVAKLHELGAGVIQLPVIELSEPEDAEPMRKSIAELESYDWIVFSSANSVDYFFWHVDDLRRIRARICAIGDATSAAVRAFRVGVDLVPEEHVAEGVAAAFGSLDLRGKRVLFPRASGARDVIPSCLEAQGALVDAPEAYRNVIPQDAESRIHFYFAKGRKPAWITFTSPSTVRNFLALAGAAKLQEVRVATIGPTTTAAARKHGLVVDAEATAPSVDALVEAILRG